MLQELPSGNPLHPPGPTQDGVAAVNLSVNIAMFFPNEGTTNQTATRTTFFDPIHLETECFYQLGQLLETEYRVERQALIEALRMVADKLEKEK